MKFPNNIEHALSIINLYFSLQPKRWLYEPKEKFVHDDQYRTWAPDCIINYQNKVFVCEVQLSPLSQSRWAEKWSHFNDFFNGGYFTNAAFQKWSSKVFMPQFICITNQDPANVKNGFDINGRELIVTRSFQ